MVKKGGQRMTNKELEKVVEYYGKEKQCNMAMEECAELIQAINKCLRYPDDHQRRECLIEEIVDVDIMIRQLMYIFSIGINEYKPMMERKEKRIMDRLHFDEVTIKETRIDG